ncbi:Zinc finger RNA-binding protein, partial [Penaeus vannamei]
AAANAAAAYQTGQTGYPVGHTPTGTQRAAGSTYDTGYQTAAAAAAATHSTAAGTYPSGAASTTYDYGYGRTTQTAAAAAAAAYDSTKTYYAQPSTATAYTAADTHYQNKAAYTNTSAYTTTSRQTTPVATPKTSYAGAYPGAAAAAATATYNTSAYAAQTTTTNKGDLYDLGFTGSCIDEENQLPYTSRGKQIHLSTSIKIHHAQLGGRGVSHTTPSLVPSSSTIKRGSTTTAALEPECGVS